MAGGALMGGATSRRKGVRFELEVCERLRRAGARCAERTLHEPRDGNVGDVETDLPLVVQCKVGARPNPWAALEEAQEAARARNGHGKRHAVAIVKRNRGNGRDAVEMAVLPLADFEEMVRRLVEAGRVVTRRITLARRDEE